MMKYSFHPEAEVEFNEAINYFEEIKSGLGCDFSDEIFDAIERSISMPDAWPVIHKNIRRTLLRRFPFGVLYSVEMDEIYVIAVMHLHRHPGYWLHRV